MKIRLMSARLDLFAALSSRIHLDKAQLQLRKICENIAQLCAIAAEIQSDAALPGSRKEYNANRALKYLEGRQILQFPLAATLKRESQSEEGVQNFSLNMHEDADALSQLRAIYKRCDEQLHEHRFTEKWPAETAQAQEGLFA